MTSKIIKGGETKKPEICAHHAADVLPESGGILHKRVLDAHEQAKGIVAEARADAARIRAEATAVLDDAKAKRQEAIKKGYAEGESKGLAKVTEKLIRLEELRTKFYADAEPEVIKLVMLITEKIIGRLAMEETDLIRSVVRQALENTLGDRITVRVNPEDYKAIMSGDHEFKDVIDRTRRLLFREDEAISRGGCIVETEVGTIDARVETQLEAIRKALTV